MARTIYRYELFNTQPDRALGITLPFNRSVSGYSNRTDTYTDRTSGKGVFNQSYSTEAQSISNLKNLLLTIRGERVMQPSYGTNLQRLIFEQSVDDLRTEIENELTDSINFWLPYIIINDIEITAVPDSYSIRITLTFSVTETGAEQVINILAQENALVIETSTLDVALGIRPI